MDDYDGRDELSLACCLLPLAAAFCCVAVVLLFLIYK